MGLRDYLPEDAIVLPYSIVFPGGTILKWDRDVPDLDTWVYPTVSCSGMDQNAFMADAAAIKILIDAAKWWTKIS